MTYNPYRQSRYDAYYGTKYGNRTWDCGQDCCRDQHRPREADPRGPTPRASQHARRDDPLRGAGYPRASPSDDKFYERIRHRLGKDMGVGWGGPTNDEFGDMFGQTRAELHREGGEAGVNYHYHVPRPMPPPRGGGRFDGYAPGYDYPPDPRTRPRAFDPPSTRQYHPYAPRDRSRSAYRRDGERPRQTRPRPKEPFRYVYVGTTDPDGEILDGYENYRE